MRELRGAFPRVKRIVETEGSIIIADRGVPKYLITLYMPPAQRSPRPKDYLARLKQHQPKPMDAAAAAELSEENRGDR